MNSILRNKSKYRQNQSKQIKDFFKEMEDIFATWWERDNKRGYMPAYHLIHIYNVCRKISVGNLPSTKIKLILMSPFVMVSCSDFTANNYMLEGLNYLIKLKAFMRFMSRLAVSFIISFAISSTCLFSHFSYLVPLTQLLNAPRAGPQ